MWRWSTLTLLVLVGALTCCEAGKKVKKSQKAVGKKEEFRLSSTGFANGGEFPTDNRGDQDNVNPGLAWTGVPKNTQSFVLIVDSEGQDAGARDRKTHWIVYDIPKEVHEIRDELSGAGASAVGRLGFKEDGAAAPIVVDPMGQIDGWVDPEIERMQHMIHGAIDASFEESNRAKEGASAPTTAEQAWHPVCASAAPGSAAHRPPCSGATSFGGTNYEGPSTDGAMCSFKLYALSTRLNLPAGASREAVMSAMKGKVLGERALRCPTPPAAVLAATARSLRACELAWACRAYLSGGSARPATSTYLPHPPLPSPHSSSTARSEIDHQRTCHLMKARTRRAEGE
jgi:phosphatidylethanolamine-binding protein (PEBP) family uncharacterized protein